MPTYYSVEQISAETNVSEVTIYKKARLLGIDASRIGKKQKYELIDALADTISRKNKAKEVLEAQKSVKVGYLESIVGQSGSTIEIRLLDAKREYDAVNTALVEIEEIIKDTGRIVSNGNTASTSMSSAMKTKLELLKQFISLQKTIQDLEDKLKYSIMKTEESAIDD